MDPFRQALGIPESNEAERQIVWAPLESESGEPGKQKPKASGTDWTLFGNRTQDGVGLEGDVAPLLDTPELSTPQAIGINFFRANQQNSVLGNSDVRARVSYWGGRSGKLTFDCDWRGGLVIHGTKVQIDVVSFRVSQLLGYVRSTNVILGVSCGVNAVHASTDPTLTYVPVDVASDATRAIEIPTGARRVSLIMKYSSDPGDPGVTGDAPLGSTFLSFSDPDGNAMCWIDALNTRSVVFGQGLAIPHGARYLGLSNKDAAATQLGAVFHLGF